MPNFEVTYYSKHTGGVDTVNADGDDAVGDVLEKIWDKHRVQLQKRWPRIDVHSLGLALLVRPPRLGLGQSFTLAEQAGALATGEDSAALQARNQDCIDANRQLLLLWLSLSALPQQPKGYVGYELRLDTSESGSLVAAGEFSSSLRNPVPASARTFARAAGTSAMCNFVNIKASPHRHTQARRRVQPLHEDQPDVDELQRRQASRLIYNVRPTHLSGPPVTVYIPAFSRLKEKLSQLHAAQLQDDLATGVIAKTGALFCAACEVHSDTRTGDRALLPILGDILEELAEGGRRKRAAERVAIPGVHGPRPGIDVSLCPAIIVAIAAPYICFYGAVLVDVLIYVAKILQVVWEPPNELRGWYKSLRRLNSDPDVPPRTSCRIPPMFSTAPSPADCTWWKGSTIPGGAPRARAQTPAAHSSHVAGRLEVAAGARSTRKVLLPYGERAHRLLAEHEPPLAPKLHFCVPLLGGVTMAGMDIVAGGASDVSSALEMLHMAGLVHGDVRRQNVMAVRRDGRAGAMLVDFDWAGEDGRVRYPAWLNVLGEIA
ncbi:hypothetical protein K466DRAFT_599624 [Polyporus arcularius HHB13444]|uniref:Protein kinase domain-containing protein n=1 Tax=Polyporus arcularius HHB13444 TaxID=1314778 RepID=A0A5C3PBZ7_9APHY|nr:hypothetical protein K466DRAFT_599624 [Polyporus arcularius HHB13444]